MEKLLELALKKAKQAEVFNAQSENTTISLENGRLKVLEASKELTNALRLIENGKLGLSYTTKIDNPSNLLEQALTSSKYGPEVGFDFPKNFKPMDLKNSSSDNTPTEKMVEECFNIYNYLKKELGNVSTIIYLGITTGSRKILNSSGLNIEDFSSCYQFDILAQMEGTAIGPEEKNISIGFEKFPKAKLDNLVKRYKVTKNKIAAKTKETDVIFMPVAIPSLLSRLEHAISSKNVLQNISYLKDKKGEKIFDETISIYDDPRIISHPFSCAFDDEGVETAKKVIVEKGFFKNFVNNLETASKLKDKPTGNGFRMESFGDRNFTGKVGQSPVMLTFDAGKQTYEDMIKSIKDGIMVEYCLGAHSGNIPAGDFSIGVIGYAIKNGELAGRLMDGMVSGNIYKNFKQIKAISSQLSFTKKPYILFDKMTVAGK